MPQLNLYKKAPSQNTLKFWLILCLCLLGETLLFIFLTSLQDKKIILLQEQHETFAKNEQRLANKLEIERKKLLSKAPEPIQKISIQEVMVDKKRSVELLKKITTTLPNQAWLDKVEEDTDHFKIVGFATNHDKISNYIDSLEKTNEFYEINLLYSEKQKKTRYHKFSITCFYKKRT